MSSHASKSKHLHLLTTFSSSSSSTLKPTSITRQGLTYKLQTHLSSDTSTSQPTLVDFHITRIRATLSISRRPINTITTGSTNKNEKWKHYRLTRAPLGRFETSGFFLGEEKDVGFRDSDIETERRELSEVMAVGFFICERMSGEDQVKIEKAMVKEEELCGLYPDVGKWRRDFKVRQGEMLEGCRREKEEGRGSWPWGAAGEEAWEISKGEHGWPWGKDVEEKGEGGGEMMDWETLWDTQVGGEGEVWGSEEMVGWGDEGEKVEEVVEIGVEKA